MFPSYYCLSGTTCVRIIVQYVTTSLFIKYYILRTWNARLEDPPPTSNARIHTYQCIHILVVVVFTLNRYFYPTTSAVTPAAAVSLLILHPREMVYAYYYAVTDSEKKQIKSRQEIKLGKSSASVPGTKASTTKKVTREIRTTKKILDEY